MRYVRNSANVPDKVAFKPTLEPYCEWQYAQPILSYEIWVQIADNREIELCRTI